MSDMVEVRAPVPPSGVAAAAEDAAPERFSAASGEAYFREAAEILAKPRLAGRATSDAGLLVRHYGLAGSLRRLASEVEETADVRLPDGTRLILKTACGPEARRSFAFQAHVLSGLDESPGFVVSRILRTSAGNPTFAEGPLSGYLQTRLEGRPLHEAPRDAALLHAAGRALGALDVALAPLSPPALHRPVLWNVGCWPRLMALEAHLPADATADDVRRAMRDYVEGILPKLGALDWQVTHNDPSPHNIMATDRGIGFIDFGDGGWAPRIQDLAIAASHFVTDPAFALGGAEPVIAGYASVLPLSALDKASLVGLIRARQGAMILINAWRSALFPDEAPYINKNVARARLGLSILSRLNAAAAEAAVSAAAM